MSNTLYLIQASAAATPTVLKKLKQIYTPLDQVVFFAEALPLLTQADLEFFALCFCLESEQGLLAPDLISGLTLLNYSQFADLVLQFERCISLK